MKKILSLFLSLSLFFVFSTSSFALSLSSGSDEIAVAPFEKSLLRSSAGGNWWSNFVDSIDNSFTNMVENDEKLVKDALSKIISASRSLSVYNSNAMDNLYNLIMGRYGVDQPRDLWNAVKSDITVNADNSVNMYVPNINLGVNDFLVSSINDTESTFNVPSLDVSKLTFKYSDGTFADSAFLRNVCLKYQDDFYISLSLSGEISNGFYTVSQLSGSPFTIFLLPKEQGNFILTDVETISSVNNVRLAGFNTLYSWFPSGNGGSFRCYICNLNLSYSPYSIGTGGYKEYFISLPFYYRSSSSSLVGFNGYHDTYNEICRVPISWGKRINYTFTLGNNPDAGDVGYVVVDSVSPYEDMTSNVTESVFEGSPSISDIQQYTDFRDLISGNGNTVNQGDIYNYVTNIYPNGNNYTGSDVANDNTSGGLLDGLSNSFGSLGTAIGSILGGLVNGIINVLLELLQTISRGISLLSSAIPQAFRDFMGAFYGLMPPEIMNALIGLFSFAVLVAIIKLLRK